MTDTTLIIAVGALGLFCGFFIGVYYQWSNQIDEYLRVTEKFIKIMECEKK